MTPSDGEDILYKFTAPSNGTFVFDTLGSPTDTVLYAWADCGGSELVCNDDFAVPTQGNTSSYIGLVMTAGQSVVIAVDSYSTSGPFTLNIAGPVTPGDCCAQRSTPGCEVLTIETCICDVDGPCCSNEWDRLCVEEAINICEVVCN